MATRLEILEKKHLNIKLKAGYKKYVAYFNSGAIDGDRPMTWTDWKKGTAAKEITSKFKRGKL